MNRPSKRELRRQLNVPAPEAPPELLRRLRKAIPEDRFGAESDRGPAGRRSRSIRWGQREWGIAAGLVVLLASGLLAIRLGVGGDRASSEPVAQEERTGDRAKGRTAEAEAPASQIPTAPSPAPTPSAGVEPETLFLDGAPEDRSTTDSLDRPAEPRRQSIPLESPSPSAEPAPSRERLALSEPEQPAMAGLVERPSGKTGAEVESENEARSDLGAEFAREARRGSTAVAEERLDSGAAALEARPGLQIETQRFEAGVWRLDGRADAAGDRRTAGDTPSLWMRLAGVGAPADPDLAEQDASLRAEAEPPRSVVSAAVGPDGRFSLAIPCAALGLSEEVMALELVDENGVVIERFEIPALTPCAGEEGERR